MFNQVIIIGRLTTDPELTYSASGASICKFTLADNFYYNEQEHTNFTRFTAFNKTAQNINEFCVKGQLVQVTGRLNNYSYEQDGIQRFGSEVIVSKIVFLAKPSDKNTEKNQKKESFKKYSKK